MKTYGGTLRSMNSANEISRDSDTSKANEAEELVALGNVAASEGHHERAIELFVRALDQGAVWCGINLGNSYREIGRLDLARVAFERAWRDGDPDAGFNLALLQEDEGDIPATRRTYRELISQSYVKAMDQEAWYLRDDGDYDASRKLMSQASISQSAEGNRAAAILGAWIWEDLRDATAEALLIRGASEWPEAWSVIQKIRSRTGIEQRLNP